MAVFSQGCTERPTERPAGKPNIIFILADDMGYSDMSWQSSAIQTPTLDKMKAEGMFLKRHYTQPQCTPSRVAFLTGNYPYRYGLHEHIVMGSSYTGIPGEVKTIAEKMKEAEYKTAIIGKWHVGGQMQSYLPHNQGFDHSFVCINGAISYWNYTHAGESDLMRNGEKVYAPSMEDSESSGNRYATYMWADEAVEVINSHGKEEPLFMFLSLTAPHHPLEAPQEKLDKYPLDSIAKYWAGEDAEMGRTAPTRQYYMAMVDAMDEAIGNVLHAVEKNGMKENTLVVFCSDNGGIIEADNRPLRSIKGDSFEGGIHVPGIVYWPGTVEEGSVSEELVHISDWYATFADAAGISYENEHLDGVSALNVIYGGEGQRDHIAIISEQRHALISFDYALVGNSNNYQRSVNNSLANFQLYDLQADLSQRHSTQSNAIVRERMKEQLASYFPNVNRGMFNWDVMYAQYRSGKKESDHSFDRVINDIPVLKVSESAALTSVSISPVSDQLHYVLQGSSDGETWQNIDAYLCRENEERYDFPAFDNEQAWEEYRVVTNLHHGLPTHISFSPEEGYSSGPLFEGSRAATRVRNLPECNGFLNLSEISGAKNVQIIDESLGSKEEVGEGGSLFIQGSHHVPESFLTKYLQEPVNEGKMFVSMLLKFEALEAESMGQVNFLVQNGWSGATEKQVSLCIQNDAIYCYQQDSPKGEVQEHWLSDYHNEVLHLVFEFDMGTLGQDELKIYLSPDNLENTEAAAILRGELSFDRLQFCATGRPGGKLTIDEVVIGPDLKDLY